MIEVFIRSVIASWQNKPSDVPFDLFVTQLSEELAPFAGTIDLILNAPEIKGVASKEFMDEGIKFAKWFNDKLKPSHISCNDATIKKWACEYERLRRIDNKTKEEIIAAVKFAREDEFWSRNFLTPMKLRSSNKESVKYVDVFLEAMKERKKKPAVTHNKPYNPTGAHLND